MQIEIKTNNYAENKNFLAVTSAIIGAGFEYHLQMGGKQSERGAVTLTTKAPREALEGVAFTASAVTIRD